MWPRMWFAFWAASSHCLLVSISTPKWMYYGEMHGLQKEHAHNYLYTKIAHGFYIKTTMVKCWREVEGYVVFFSTWIYPFLCVLSSENAIYSSSNLEPSSFSDYRNTEVSQLVYILKFSEKKVTPRERRELLLMFIEKENKTKPNTGEESRHCTPYWSTHAGQSDSTSIWANHTVCFVLCSQQVKIDLGSAVCWGIWVTFVNHGGDTAREKVSKGLGEDQSFPCALRTWGLPFAFQ